MYFSLTLHMKEPGKVSNSKMVEVSTKLPPSRKDKKKTLQVKTVWRVGPIKWHWFDQDSIKLTSGQDGGVGRHTVPPRTTKRRTTAIYKQKATRTNRKTNCMEVRHPRS